MVIAGPLLPDPVDLGDGYHRNLESRVCHRAPLLLVSVACVAANGGQGENGTPAMSADVAADHT